MSEETSAQDIIDTQVMESDETIAAFKRELKRIRTGKASPGLVEGIVVDYYGAKTAVSHLGQITAPEPRQLHIQVFDSNATPLIEKAIANAGLGLNPSAEGSSIRINIPALTEDSRKEIVRHLHKMAEDKRVSIRNHRRDANDSLKKLEKDNEISKDDLKRYLDEVQKHTDAYIAQVDEMLSSKEAECLEV